MEVINTEKQPIKIWSKNTEAGAISQLKNLANLPFIHKWVCAMPDCHQGYGMPIGGVIATEGVIIPNAVGVDIGCGMCAVKTSLTEISQDQLKEIMAMIRKTIPVGFKHHSKKQDESLMPKVPNSKFYSEEHLRIEMPICGQEYQNALTQIGTLGGGNHFIEIQKGDDGHIWIMIHSGSRNLGYQVANHYNKVAQELCRKWYSNIPEFHGEDGLAFLPIDTKEGQDYLNEMQYCVDFALANRLLMMNRIMESFEKIIGKGNFGSVQDIINIAHNYASIENHFGKNVWVHRKGATKASKGLVGIIPGSMGTSSYIVEGLGNPESFESCSHGAGRKMGRNEAVKTLDLKHEQEIMKGILGAPRTKEDLQEAPGAYKDILDVMENQKDLVKILVELKPLAVIKG